MRRNELEGLRYILPIETVPSVMAHGLLSHRLSQSVSHTSIAMTQIQDIRARVVIPGGRPLHEYVNLYFNARNKMMFKVRFAFKVAHEILCVLKIDDGVLDLPGVVITDQNASSRYCRFSASPPGLQLIDRDFVFARSWRHPDDQILEWRHGSAVCAEVLVPERVHSNYVTGAYVSCAQAERQLVARASGLAVTIEPDMFFA